MSANEQGQHQLDAIIIGAGFSGLYQMHCLRDQQGLSVLGLDMADGVGGTWYWNRYPGARCDSESHSYAYYFSDTLLQAWTWSERYPGQAEILRYLNFVADHYDLKRSFRFKTKVVSAQYQEAENLWLVTTDSGEHYRASFLISAVGNLSAANLPSIAGLDRFKGQWYHTGQWPHEGVDFSGQRVAVVGTGSTGIQAIPVIAAQAQQLTVFQRTANYSIPARNGPLDEAFIAYCKSRPDEIRKIMHATTNGHPFYIQERSALDVSEEERLAIYEEAWETGGLRFRSSFKDLLTSEAANKTAADFIRTKIKSIIRDPKKADLLSDIDHPFAAKRPPIDTDYFETYNLAHVDLVNLREDPIVSITEDGIQTNQTHYAFDAIVFATGFDAMTRPLLNLNLKGRKGQSLSNAWQAGPSNYLGLQVPGFPNFFMVTGPGSPSVLANMPVAIEQHVEWISACIAYLRSRGVASIEAREDACERWMHEVNAAAAATLLPKAKHSWYLGANIPGKPRIFMPYAGGMAQYRRRCESVTASGYDGFALQ
ncbi:MAG: NAD(P)/FAD-dependent oxidoreductase [Betaproteobacteria bacterium]|nr:NAD(P)/FAD-dependent oxidoreductase [Betaproteobacteria bacterium]